MIVGRRIFPTVRLPGKIFLPAGFVLASCRRKKIYRISGRGIYMKKKFNNKYFRWGLTAFLVIAAFCAEKDAKMLFCRQPAGPAGPRGPCSPLAP